MPRQKKVTLKHIAKELDLTVHTVSKALRGLPGMAESTRREVFATAKRLGYVTKAQEMGKKAELLSPNLHKGFRFVMMMSGDQPFFRMQLEGVQERLHELGHSVDAKLLPSTVQNASQFREWVDSSGILFADGLFISPVFAEETEQMLLELPLPKILINFPAETTLVDSVIWDVKYAVSKSVEYLHACGHRNILYIGEIGKFRGFYIRWFAFKEMMKKYGISVHEEEHITTVSKELIMGTDILKSALDAGRYSAILCGTSQYAQLVNYKLQSIGIGVPDEVSLIGIEDDRLNAFPQLTGPILLIRETGQRAAELLVRRVANPLLPYEHTQLVGGFEAGHTVSDLLMI